MTTPSTSKNIAIDPEHRADAARVLCDFVQSEARHITDSKALVERAEHVAKAMIAGLSMISAGCTAGSEELLPIDLLFVDTSSCPAFLEPRTIHQAKAYLAEQAAHWRTHADVTAGIQQMLASGFHDIQIDYRLRTAEGYDRQVWAIAISPSDF